MTTEATQSTLVAAADARYEAARSLFATAPKDWTDEQYREAEQMLAQIHTELKRAEEERLAQTRPLDEAKKRIMDFFRRITGRYEEAKSLLKQGMTARNAEIERRRQEEERRLREEAEARLREERRQAEEAARIAREEAEKEAARIAAEAAARAQQVRDAEEAARIQREAEARAQEALAVGDELAAEAEAQVQAVALTPLPTLPREKPKNEVELWHGECVDLGKLVLGVCATMLRCAVARDEKWREAQNRAAELLERIAYGESGYTHVPLSALEPNTKLIGQQARSLKAELRWPGVRVWSTRDVKARGVRA